jgi:hypothetical protein
MEALKENSADWRSDLIMLARIAENSERYEDMCQFMRERVVNFSDPLISDERNLLSVAYKNVIGSRRSAWRTLYAEIEESGPSPELTKYKDQVEKELETISLSILNLLETNLIKEGDENNGEEQVFYLKMAGDYYRYLTETSIDSPNQESYKTKTGEFYEKASVMARDTLAPTHPIRLGLALNHSVCYYEILKEPEKACALAKEAFDQAISKLDLLSEADYKDSTLIMQLLRDNLTLWTSNNEDVEVEDLS